MIGAEDHRTAALHAFAAEMEADGRGRDDPIRAVFALIGDRWTMLILLTLAIDSWRHAELRRVLSSLSWEGAIAQRVLTEKLRALERNGFVSRDVTDDVPPHVTYSLTESGRGLVDQSRALLGWVKDRRTAIDEARRLFDQAQD